MPTSDQPALAHRFADRFPELSVAHDAAPTQHRTLLALNEPLAAELGLDPDWLRTDAGVRLLTGEAPGPHARPVAQGYAGHQFGGYSPVLGDGRALLLGELNRPSAREPSRADTGLTDLVDLHLKGSGRTPFSRPGSDGLAAVGPMLRELVIGEALHAIGVPTTRALAVAATGVTVQRDRPLPGAVLSRTAASHLRVGTFQYAAALAHQRSQQGDDASDLVARLVDESLRRHHPAADPGLDSPVSERARALLAAVVRSQAELVTRWMLIGFVHGVMNTDNMTISGESIDFGPCAFMEAFDPDAVFSSIDRAGRYAFGNQPAAAQWNLARFAETLLPLLAGTTEAAVEIAQDELAGFARHQSRAWLDGLRAKLGLGAAAAVDDAQVGGLADRLFPLLAEHGVDWTAFWANLADLAPGDDRPQVAVDADPFVPVPAALQTWYDEWASLGPDREAMRRANPRRIPRNRPLDAALTSAEAGDLADVERILAAVRDPFTPRADAPDLERPASPDAGPFVTYCGT